MTSRVNRSERGGMARGMAARGDVDEGVSQHFPSISQIKPETRGVPKPVT